MSQSAFDKLLEKYLAGKCTEEEEKLVLEWYEDFIKDTDLELTAAERLAIESKIWQSLKAGVTMEPAEERRKKVRRLPVFSRIAAAACLTGIVIAGAWFWLHRQSPPGVITASSPGQEQGQQYERLANATKTAKRLLLADSTEITLQPGAAISYPPAFADGNREVYLTGSAFFTVNHNPQKHFKVHVNGELTTEVLGTSFRIVQNGSSGRIEVQVMTGKVCVYPLRKEKVAPGQEEERRIVLTPNKKVIFNAVSNQFVTSLIDNPQPLWKPISRNDIPETGSDKQFAFEDEPLSNVLEALSKTYGINIIPGDDRLGRVHFTGNIAPYDLYRKLDIICLSTQSTYEIEGTQIVLRRKKEK